MSRRNSKFQKAIRREQRITDKERATFIHDAANEGPVVDGKPMMWLTRKERRNAR